MDVNLVLDFVTTALFCEIDGSVLGEQSWSPYEYDDGMLIILRKVESIKFVLPDGT